MSLVYLCNLSGKTSGMREIESLCKHPRDCYLRILSQIKIFHLRGNLVKTSGAKKDAALQNILRMCVCTSVHGRKNNTGIQCKNWRSSTLSIGLPSCIHHDKEARPCLSRQWWAWTHSSPKASTLRS